MRAILDTHTVLWYLERSANLFNLARQAIEAAIAQGDNVYVSAISLVETVYLAERNRVPATALQRLRTALRAPIAGLIVAEIDFAVANALENIPRAVVPDMPDRIIAAPALRLAVPLITRDRRLQSAGLTTLW